MNLLTLFAKVPVTYTSKSCAFVFISKCSSPPQIIKILWCLQKRCTSWQKYIRNNNYNAIYELFLNYSEETFGNNLFEHFFMCATLFYGNLSAVKYIYLFINCISEEEIVAQVSATTVLIHLYLTLVVCDNCIILSQKM